MGVTDIMGGLQYGGEGLGSIVRLPRGQMVSRPPNRCILSKTCMDTVGTLYTLTMLCMPYHAFNVFLLPIQALGEVQTSHRGI